MTDGVNPPRILVCGTRFGEHYLASLATPGARYRLAGILARGSARSAALAQHFDVPLYPHVDAVPDDGIDIVCVVVRTALFDGQGTALAQAFLERGLPVLQEHPAHPGEVARLKRLARQNQTTYQVNAFYPHLPAGRCWIDYIGRAMRGGERLPQFLEMTTSPQLLYSSLDLLGRAMGGLETTKISGPLHSAQSPFHTFVGTVNDIPFTLNFQSFLDPSDPDHHSLVMHKMAALWPEGTVQLTNSFGPVLWSHALYAPDYDRDDRGASYILSPELHRACRYFSQPSATALGDPEGEPIRDVVARQFPDAVAAALDDVWNARTGSAATPFQSEDYLLSLGQFWLKIMQMAGQPRMLSLPPPPPPFPDPVDYAQTERSQIWMNAF